MKVKRIISFLLIFVLLLGSLCSFSASSGGNTIPDYISAEAESVADVIEATDTGNNFVFPTLTDFHLYVGNSNHDASLLATQYAGMGISELEKYIDLDFVGYLGDYTWGSKTYEAEQVIKDIEAVKETVNTDNKEIWCVGNHDINYGANRDRLLTNEELYNYIGANSDGEKPEKDRERCYGYLDFDDKKMRVIYLNTCDVSDWAAKEGEEAPASWISPTQLQWLADTALDFSHKKNAGEWGVVIVSHHPLHYAQSCYSSAMQILEAYRDGKSGSISTTIRTEVKADGTIDYPQQKVTYDFSHKKRAEIICNIHGHNHNCASSKISSSSWLGSDSVEPWLLRICIPNICANRYNTGYESFKEIDGGLKYGELDENGEPVYWTKETDSADATSFCVVNIDRESKKIYTHIFGAGKDRVFSYGDADINLMNSAAGRELIEVYSEKMYAGDVTGDGKINMLDSFELKKYILGYETNALRFTMDTDGNGKTDVMDLFNVKLIVKGLKGAESLGNTTVKKAFDENEKALKLTVTEAGDTDAFFDINTSGMDLSAHKYVTIVWKGNSKAEVGFVDANHNTEYSANVKNITENGYGYAIAEIVEGADNCNRIEVKYGTARGDLYIDSVIFSDTAENAEAAARERLK